MAVGLLGDLVWWHSFAVAILGLGPWCPVFVALVAFAEWVVMQVWRCFACPIGMFLGALAGIFLLIGVWGTLGRKPGGFLYSWHMWLLCPLAWCRWMSGGLQRTWHISAALCIWPESGRRAGICGTAWFWIWIVGSRHVSWPRWFPSARWTLFLCLPWEGGLAPTSWAGHPVCTNEPRWWAWILVWAALPWCKRCPNVPVHLLKQCIISFPRGRRRSGIRLHFCPGNPV